MPDAIDAIFISSVSQIRNVQSCDAWGSSGFEAVFDEIGKRSAPVTQSPVEPKADETETSDLAEGPDLDQTDSVTPDPDPNLSQLSVYTAMMVHPDPAGIPRIDPRMSGPSPAQESPSESDELGLQAETPSPPENDGWSVIADLLATGQSAPADTVGQHGQEYIPGKGSKHLESDERIVTLPGVEQAMPNTSGTGPKAEIASSALPLDASGIAPHPVHFEATAVIEGQTTTAPSQSQQRVDMPSDAIGSRETDLQLPNLNESPAGKPVPSDRSEAEPVHRAEATGTAPPPMPSEPADRPVRIRAAQTAAVDEKAISTLIEGLEPTGGIVIRIGEAQPIFTPSNTSGPGSSPHLAAPREILQQVTRQLGKLDEGQIEITLTPEELGKVRMVVTPGDTPAITIYADRSDTLDLLRRNTELLARELRDTGFAGASLSFGDGRDDRPDRNHGTDNTTVGRPDAPSRQRVSEEAATEPQRISSARQIDMRI